MKTCNKCGVEKEDSEFPPQKRDCKKCRALYMKEYRKENADRLKSNRESKKEHKYEAARKWKHRNPDKVKANRLKHAEKTAEYKRERYKQLKELGDKLNE